MEVVGVPLRQPGYHVLEVASPRLGQSLLEPPGTMYVRTGVLVTNLGIHFKLGRDNSLAWVTALDSGRPVAGAKVSVYDCTGKPIWSGKADDNGIARIDRPNLSQRPSGECLGDGGLYVTARHTPSGQPEDFSFLFTSWNRGIETWRFNLPTSWGGNETTARAHTITDRPLLRPGEKLSMKHFFRLETLQGLSDAPPSELPTELRVVFAATGEEVYKQTIKWQGTRYALSQWQVPPAPSWAVIDWCCSGGPTASEACASGTAAASRWMRSASRWWMRACFHPSPLRPGPRNSPGVLSSITWLAARWRSPRCRSVRFCSRGGAAIPATKNFPSTRRRRSTRMPPCPHGTRKVTTGRATMRRPPIRQP